MAAVTVGGILNPGAVVGIGMIHKVVAVTDLAGATTGWHA